MDDFDPLTPPSRVSSPAPAPVKYSFIQPPQQGLPAVAYRAGFLIANLMRRINRQAP
jgi:hypothetical protein